MPAGVLLLMVSTISAGCGGDDDLTPLEEFFQQVQADYDDFAERNGRLEELRERGDKDLIEVAEEILPELVVLRRAFLDGLDALNPPSEAEDAFGEYLTAGRELVRLGTVVLYPGDEALAQAAWERYQETCGSLHEIASANGIVVDLECSEGL